MRKCKFSNDDCFPPEMVIDMRLNGDVPKEQWKHIDSIFNALNCDEVPFEHVFHLLKKHAKLLIGDEKSRCMLFKYLQDEILEYPREELRDMEIIPVYDQKGETMYVPWSKEIFVKENTYTSTDTYWILNTSILPKQDCEKMLGVNINVMNEEYEQNQYCKGLRKRIEESRDRIGLYNYLLNEFNNGHLRKNSCIGVLLELKGKIPLKNELEDITLKELYICDEPGCFDSKMIRSMTVHKECKQFAEFIRCKSLSEVYFKDISYKNLFIADDDIEYFQEEYFKNSEDILRGFYLEGKLKYGLMEEYDLGYLCYGDQRDNCDNWEYKFPEKPISNKVRLLNQIKRLLENPIEIVTEKVERLERKGRRKNGQSFELNKNEAREEMLQIYTPEGNNPHKAFCQMCCKLKDYKFMEVNELELEPKYYFSQTRVALCLECSKRFEDFRRNNKIRGKYLDAICSAKISNEGTVKIPLHKDCTLTFTATHLAEVQELLKGIRI